MQRSICFVGGKNEGRGESQRRGRKQTIVVGQTG